MGLISRVSSRTYRHSCKMADSSDPEKELQKLPLLEKLQHSNWKCRKIGYEELGKKVALLDEDSQEYKSITGLLKKFLVDTNELMRIQGSELVLKFAESGTAAVKKQFDSCTTSIIDKCLGSKPKLKENAKNIILTFFELEVSSNEKFLETFLTKGLKSKQPKVLIACLEILTACFNGFGLKVFTKKQLVSVSKAVVDLCTHRDKNVREAC